MMRYSMNETHSSNFDNDEMWKVRAATKKKHSKTNTTHNNIDTHLPRTGWIIKKLGKVEQQKTAEGKRHANLKRIFALQSSNVCIKEN